MWNLIGVSFCTDGAAWLDQRGVKLSMSIRPVGRGAQGSSRTFMRNTFRPDLTVLSSKVNSFSRMIARLSLSPVYVTT